MSEQQENYFIQKNAELYLTTYILKEFEKIHTTHQDIIDEWFSSEFDLYHAILGVYLSSFRLYQVLWLYLQEEVIEKVICKIDILEEEKQFERIFTKDIKNNSLWCDIMDYISISKDSLDIIEIFLSKPNIKKLQDIIDRYIGIWEQNLFQSSRSNFYKKEKQIEIVKKYIQNSLKDYDKNNLIIKMRDFNDGIQYKYPSECPMDILATLLYLEKINYLKLKELRLSEENFYNLVFVVDIKNNTPIQDNKLKLSLVNSNLSYKTQLKVFWKQKDLIEVLFKNNWRVSENEAYEYVYWDFRNNDPIRSLIVNTNKKLDQVGYNHKIHKENGKIVLEME